MPSPELDAIMAQARAAPFDPSVPEKKKREQIDRFGDLFPVPSEVTVNAVTLGGVPGERLIGVDGGPLVLFLHGGGYVMGSPKSHRHLAARLAADILGEVYVLDYRLAPEIPFPGALNDSLAAYRALSAQSHGRAIVLVGDSAGGGLAFATAVAIRDQGLSTPAALIGISPWVNLGTESESYDKLSSADPILSRAVCDYCSSRYLDGAPPKDPMTSPLFADLKGLPRTLIQVGDRECFFGDAVLMHQALIAAGVDTELRVWKEMFHVWHLYWPVLAPGRDALAEIATFITKTP